MDINKIAQDLTRQIRANRPEILAGIGVAGTVITAYLAARGGRKAQREIDDWVLVDGHPTKKDKLLFEAKVTWKCYVPAVMSGAATIAAVIASAHTGRQRTAAAFAAYSLSEKAYKEYRDQVAEDVGERKEAEIEAKVNQAQVDKHPPTEVFRPEGGRILCCELWTMRYFRADHEDLVKAQNAVNRIALRNGEAALDEFYNTIGLDSTQQSHLIGWKADAPLELRVTYVQGPNHEPTLAFNYTNLGPLD